MYIMNAGWDVKRRLEGNRIASQRVYRGDDALGLAGTNALFGDAGGDFIWGDGPQGSGYFRAASDQQVRSAA